MFNFQFSDYAADQQRAILDVYLANYAYYLRTLCGGPILHERADELATEDTIAWFFAA